MCQRNTTASTTTNTTTTITATTTTTTSSNTTTTDIGTDYSQHVLTPQNEFGTHKKYLVNLQKFWELRRKIPK